MQGRYSNSLIDAGIDRAAARAKRGLQGDKGEADPHGRAPELPDDLNPPVFAAPRRKFLNDLQARNRTSDDFELRVDDRKLPSAHAANITAICRKA